MAQSWKFAWPGALLCSLFAPCLVNGAPSADTAAAHRARAKEREVRFDYRGELREYQAAYVLDKDAHPREAAEDTDSIGDCLNALGQPQKALDMLPQALAVQRRLGDTRGEAVTLTWIGDALSALHQTAKALDALRRALPLHRRAANRAGEARTLNDLGTITSSLGQRAQALGFFRQALPLYRQAGDALGEASVLNNIGTALNGLSEYANALDAYRQALPIERRIGNRPLEAGTLGNLGTVYDNMGQFAKSLEAYRQALPLERQVGNKPDEAKLLSNIGLVYEELGQPAKALDFYRQALVIERQTGDRGGEATTLSNMGMACAALGQYARALTFDRQALPIEREIGNTQGEAATLTSMGAVYDGLGQPAKALDFYRQALPIQRQTGHKADEAVTLGNIGVIYADLGRHAQALGFFQQALTIERQIGDASHEAGTLNNAMQSWQALGKPGVAIFYGKQAVNAYQGIRENIAALDKRSQSVYLAAKADTYRTLADLLIGQGRLPEAEQVLAMLKQQEVRAFVTRDAALSPAALSVSFDTDERAVAARYQTLADPVTQLGAQLEVLRAKKNRTDADNQQIVALQDRLGPAAKAFQAFLAADLPRELAQAAPNQDRPDIAAARGPLQKQLAQMGPGTVALFTLVEPDRYRVIMVTSQTQKAEEYPIPAADLRKLILQWRAALQDPRRDPRPLGKKLSDILIGPIEEDLIGANAQTLMWSLDDVLRYVPVSALYDGQHYLVEKYRTSVFTGASVPALSAQAVDWQQGGDAGTILLALGVTLPHTVTDPATGKAVDFPALPGVADELNGIVRSAGHPDGALAGKPLEDAQFTQNALRLGLTAGYPVVHIASHFALGADYKSSFLLLGDGTALTLDALLGQGGQVFAGVDLLTLSACQTGEGGGDGHEFESLGALAQAQGASSVLASLWPVSDVTTPLLMRAFYRGHAAGPDASKAESLRQSQLSLLRGTLTAAPGQGNRAGRAVEDDGPSDLPLFTPDPKTPYAHPYYWAPFVLIGNWR